MAYDQTLIANLALGHIGDAHITDIDDDNDTRAEVLRDFYDHAVGYAYSAHDWNWAQDEAQLQALVSVPTTRYSYFHQLPAHFARVTLVSETSDMRNPLDEKEGQWKIVAGKFASNAEEVFMHYVSKNWTEAQWPAYFAECVSVKLAALVAPRITHNATLRAKLEDDFEKTALIKARVTDSQLQTVRPRLVRSQWSRDRFGRGWRKPRPDIS